MRLSEKANSFIYVDDNREWSLKPLEEDVQITVKTDLDVVEKWSQWPEEITIPAKTTKNVEFIPTEPGDYLMPDSDDSERYFSVMDEWRYCNTYYKTTDKTVYEGISVSSCTAENQARISIRFENKTDDTWTLYPITYDSDQIEKPAVAVNQEVTEAEPSTDNRIYTFKALEAGIYTIESRDFVYPAWIKNDQTGFYYVFDLSLIHI